MIPLIGYCRDDAKKNNKKEDKQLIGVKSIIIVVTIILFLCACLLPFGFYHGNRFPYTYLGYFGSFYKTSSDVRDLSNTSLSHSNGPKTTSFAVFSPFRQVKHTADDKKQRLLTVENTAEDFNDNNGTWLPWQQNNNHEDVSDPFHFRHRRAVKEEKKSKQDTYDNYEACMKGRDANYYLQMSEKPQLYVVGEQEPLELKCEIW